MKNCGMRQRMLGRFLLLCGLLLSHGTIAAQGLVDDGLEMQVKGVAMDPYGNTPIVILEDAEGHRAFPIWIGLPEAEAIARAMEGIPTPRPMTHMLMQNVLHDLRVRVDRIVINDLRNNTFYASIFLQQGSKTLTVDARPSDAIALALGVKAPIFVSKHVLGAVRTVTISDSASPQHATKKFGMHLQSLDAALAGAFHLTDTDGVLVAFVEAGSQAERYGIRRGDVITDADGRHVKNLQELLQIFTAKQVGQNLVLQVTRDRQARMVRLFLASLE
jgi:bifunctional DNase/RNase